MNKDTIASNNIIKQLTAYTILLKRLGKDKRLVASHISLFTALFIQWQQNNFNSPFSVTRKQLMSYSKIASIATYHKCVKELDEFGYILYRPSYHPRLGSLVYWPEKLA